MDSKIKSIDSAQQLCDSISLASFTQLQSFGALLVVDKKSLKIVQYSENAVDHLKTSAFALRQGIITDYLIPSVQNFDTQNWLKYSNNRYGQFVWKNTDGTSIESWVYIHQQNKLIILEIEATDDINHEQEALFVLDEFINLKENKPNEDIEATSNRICKEIQRITNYDRVSLYQFESDGSGVVLGEAIKNGLESYMGLHFPATDVPYSVRKMYLSQPLRYIPDINTAALSLSLAFPEKSKLTLDLSNVMLRAVSPVHIEYLKNMGVASALSIAIIHDGKLWGLIACQHKTAKKLSIYYRFGLLMLTQVIAKQLASITEKHDAHEKDVILQTSETIQHVIDSQTDLITAFNIIKEQVSTMFGADGIALFYDNSVSVFGQTPTTEQIKNLSDWLFKYHPSEIFVTQELSSQYPACQDYNKLAAGLLAIPLTPDMNHYLLSFRKEIISTIRWAGNPNRALIIKGNKYSPRRSFQLWSESVENQAKPWGTYQITAAKVLQNIFTNKQLKIFLEKQAQIDPLTGLYNRRTLLQNLTNEISRAKRAKKQLAIFILDIDFFKRVNDEFGHSAGDMVLAKISRVLKNTIRTHDYAYRYGGEEFLLILNDLTSDDVIQKSTHIIQQIRKLKLIYNNLVLPKITISIGIALSPKHGDNPLKLIEMADHALYQAKEGGRDRMVVFASDSSGV